MTNDARTRADVQFSRPGEDAPAAQPPRLDVVWPDEGTADRISRLLSDDDSAE